MWQKVQRCKGDTQGYPLFWAHPADAAVHGPASRRAFPPATDWVPGCQGDTLFWPDMVRLARHGKTGQTWQDWPDMARLARHGKTPTDPRGVGRPKVPMSQATTRKLENLAAALGTPRRKVSPMQVAGQLLEEAVAPVEYGLVRRIKSRTAPFCRVADSAPNQS